MPPGNEESFKDSPYAYGSSKVVFRHLHHFMALGFRFFSVSQFPVPFVVRQPSLLKMLSLSLKPWTEQFGKDQLGLSSYGEKVFEKILGCG